MNKAWLAGLVFGLGIAASPAHAIPNLQVDATGATYDTENDDSLVNADTFTVGAILGNTSPSGTYYLSVAILNADYTSVTSVTGTIKIGGTTYDVSTFAYGKPNLLPSHGVFDTVYKEFSFVYDADDPLIANYNVETDAGDWTTRLSDDGNAVVKEFAVDRTGLSADYLLHFDFYTYVSTPSGNPNKPPRLSIDFAPFSHDATGGDGPDDPGCEGVECCVGDECPPPPPQGLPEPASLLLLGAGLLGLGAVRRRAA